MSESQPVQVGPARAPGQAAERRPFHSVAEAAAILHVSPSTVWRWIEAGRLPASRVGPRNIRIRREDLAQVIQPARMERRGVSVASDERLSFEPPSQQELARRQALVKEILTRRQRRVISPLTSTDLVRRAREQERRAYDRPRA